jgi:hypothetical protein
MEDIPAAIAELRQEMTRQHAEIERQAAELSSLRAVNDFLRTTPSTTSRPKPSLPDPDKFNSTVQRFDTWLPSIRAKLQVDSPAIDNSIAQFYYIFLNLESSVQAQILPQLNTATYDYNTILDQLSCVYNNPNKIQEAEDRLTTIKQGTDSLYTYIAHFERTLYEAHSQQWPESNKITYFRQGLSSILKNRLNQQLSLPCKYDDYVRIIQQLATTATAYTSQVYPLSTNPYTNRPTSSQPQYSTDPMDLNIVGIIDGMPVYKDPSQLAPSRTLQERNKLRAQGRYIRCGKAGHLVKEYIIGPTRADLSGLGFDKE